MKSLSTLTGIIHSLPFHFYDDDKQQPARCELVVHPAQGWAVATELESETTGLSQCQLTLAARICQQYNIEPQDLALFTRYAYTDTYENVYVLHFVSGERDLFDGIRFMGPCRERLTLADVDALVARLREGQAPAPQWRALTVTA